MSSGVEKAWSIISKRPANEVIAEYGAEYLPDAGCYRIAVLGHLFLLCPSSMEVRGDTAGADELYRRHSMFFDHSVLWVLANGRCIGRTGRLVKPSAIKGGHHFFTRGTHVLPLERVATMYGVSGGEGRDAFIRRGLHLGGMELDYGDGALELMPAPCLPVTIILWKGDDEFAPRADLLFDSSAEHVAPVDVLWSAAMLALEAML